jgi:hypothetical protein
VPGLAWTSAGFTKPLRLLQETALRPKRELTASAERGVLQEVVYEAEVSHLFDTLIYEPVTACRSCSLAWPSSPPSPGNEPGRMTSTSCVMPTQTRPTSHDARTFSPGSA